jgi:hypothetical protein
VGGGRGAKGGAVHVWGGGETGGEFGVEIACVEATRESERGASALGRDLPPPAGIGQPSCRIITLDPLPVFTCAAVS